MASRTRTPTRLLFCLLVALTSSAAARASDNAWRAVDPTQLSMQSPVVEKDADAEAIFWDVVADDSGQDFVVANYIRIKVFTERGRDAQSKVELPYLDGVTIKDVAARTIKPDGSTVELKKEDVIEKTVVKAGGVKLKVKSFALQGVEPGSIIEYRWRESFPHVAAQYAHLQFQRDIPVESVTYHVKPSLHIVGAHAIRFETFPLSTPQFVDEPGGFYTATLKNVPAFREEPFMPPADSVRRWVLLFYSAAQTVDPQTYWKRVGRLWDERFRGSVKVTDEIKAKAAEIVVGAQTPDEKLERLYDFCRTQIKNLNDGASGLTDEDRAKLAKKESGPSDTLRDGRGSARDINELFAALALADGFDARLAVSCDRSRIFFDPNFADLYFMRRGISFIAVRVGEGWRFFQPASTYVPYGMLPWKAEMQDALVTDPTDPFFVRTPLSPAEKSRVKRSARLRLLEDGTVEGTVRVEYTGHRGAELKELNDDASPQQREETLRNAVRGHLSTAELSDIKIENVTDPVKPFIYEYKVRVPGYAQRTGQRLFLQPAFFEAGLGSLFPTSDRRNPIYFHYPWSESDDVEIALPEGFSLEEPDAPQAPEQCFGRYEAKVSAADGGRSLSYRRDFAFGSGSVLFPVASYSRIKSFFDAVNKADGQTVTLRRRVMAASSPGANR